MPLVIRDTSTVPHEDWTFHVEQTNWVAQTKNYSLLYPIILQHCQSNNIQPPTQQEVINYVCSQAHVPCYEYETRMPLINKFTNGEPNPPRSGGCCG